MNDFVQPLVNEIYDAADKYVKQGFVEPLSFRGYDAYLKTGHRQAFENQYFARRKQLAVLGIACVLKKEASQLALLEQVIWEICNEYTWAVPAHLPIHDHQFSEDGTRCIDLFAAETAQALSEISYLLVNDLTPMIKRRIKRELNQRIFEPFLQKEWFWEDSQNNWSAVVAGSIGMAALRLLPVKDEKQQQIVRKIDFSMQSYLGSFGSDGACEEGMGYWAYGFGYYCYYGAMLEEVLGDNRYLEGEKVKKMAVFPYHVMLSQDNFVPFSDYVDCELPAGLLTFCHERFQVEVPVIQRINYLDSDHCYRFAHLLRDVLWSKTLMPSSNQEQQRYFPDVQWLVERKEAHDFCFAAKAGGNDESHNHNDVGHFVLGTPGTLFLTDLGAGEYTKDYFVEAQRYSYLVTSARGHSVPVVNGILQESGAYRAKQVEFVQDTFSMELSEVYPKESRIEGFERHFQVDSGERTIQLQDNFIFVTDSNEIIENFVTLLVPRQVGNQVILASGEDKCILTFETEEISLKQEKYMNHREIETPVYLIQAKYPADKRAEINIAAQMV